MDMIRILDKLYNYFSKNDIYFSSKDEVRQFLDGIANNPDLIYLSEHLFKLNKDQLIKDIFDMNHKPIFDHYDGLVPRSQFKNNLSEDEYDKISRSLYDWSHTGTWRHFTIDDIEKFLEHKDHVK